MEEKLIPTHKYKTTVLFYDDNVEYLEFLKVSLISDKYNFVFVDNLNDFNAYIKQSEEIKVNLPRAFKKLDNELSDNPQHETFDFDITSINLLRNIDNKVNEISTIFVDNNLEHSEYNGLSICEKMTNVSFNKILLTGACDRIKAIYALNTKNINFYIEKYSLNDNTLYNIAEKILTELDTLTDDFFINKNSYINNLLSNQNFKLLFTEVIQNNNITEYYLFDKETFILIDGDGNKTYFKCWDLSKFDEYFNLYYDELDDKDAKELSRMKNEKLIPTKNGIQTSTNFKDLYYCMYE
jgi:hypothetical protein